MTVKNFRKGALVVCCAFGVGKFFIGGMVVSGSTRGYDADFVCDPDQDVCPTTCWRLTANVAASDLTRVPARGELCSERTKPRGCPAKLVNSIR